MRTIAAMALGLLIALAALPYISTPTSNLPIGAVDPIATNCVEVQVEEYDLSTGLKNTIETLQVCS